MQSIINEIYNGKITDRIEKMPELEELEAVQNTINDEIGYWRDKLPRNEFRRFENKILENSYDVNILVMKSSFAKGFKLGIQLLIEALYE